MKSAKRNLRVEALHAAAELGLVAVLAEFLGVIRRRYDNHFMAKKGVHGYTMQIRL